MDISFTITSGKWHGHSSSAGLSPDVQSMDQIRRIIRPTDVPDQGRSV